MAKTVVKKKAETKPKKRAAPRKKRLSLSEQRAVLTVQNKEKVLEALEKSMGIVTPAVKLAGIGRQTFYDWVEQDDEFAEKVKAVQYIQKDFGESQLMVLMKEKNPSAVIFFNKTRNRDRGYVERIEHSGSIETVTTDKYDGMTLEDIAEHRRQLELKIAAACTRKD